MRLFSPFLFVLLATFLATADPSFGRGPAPVDGPADKDGGVEWVGDKVSLSLRDADLVEVLRSFARLGDLNLILHPGIKGTVTVELKDVPWDQAMSVILQMHGLGLDVSGRTVRIAPPEELLKLVRLEGSDPLPSPPALQRVRGPVRHVDAEALVRLLGDEKARRLTRRGRIAVDAQGRITIEDTPHRLKAVTRLIRALDRPEAASWSSERLEHEIDVWWQREMGSGGF